MERAAAMRRSGSYQIQAAISAAHAMSRRYEDTDWRAITRLYAALERSQPSPVVTLNRAVALAMAEGPERGLALLDESDLAEILRDYQPFHAARADLLRRLGRTAEASESYRAALTLTRTDAERRFLERRLTQLRH